MTSTYLRRKFGYSVVVAVAVAGAVTLNNSLVYILSDLPQAIVVESY